MIYLRKLLRRGISRRLVAAAVLVAQVLTGSGIPLPVGYAEASAAAAASTPFPCEHHNCGCRTASECWRSCCCQTVAERLEWARSHNVTPPADWIAEASEIERRAASRRLPVKASSCCAAQPAKRSCCCQAPAEKSCCAKPEPAATVESRPTGRFEWLSFLEAARCHGGSANWLNAPWAVPPLPPVSTSSSEQAFSPFCGLTEIVALSPSFVPPKPPPRVA